MRLFAAPGFEPLAAELLEAAGMRAGAFRLGRFANREWHLEVETGVAGEECAVLGSSAPPDTQLVQVTLLAHALKRAGAGRVTAVLPYLGYARQDQAGVEASLGMAWVGQLLRGAGVDAVVTVDAHSERDRELLEMPLASVSPAGMWAATMRARELAGAALAAPDQGAVARCEAVREHLGGTAPIVSFEKRRTRGGVELGEPSSAPGERVVLVDDILDTGQTLVLAARALARHGAREIHILATHGIFSGNRWRELLQPPVRSLTVTDTVAARRGNEHVPRLPVAPLLRAWVAARHGDSGAGAPTPPVGRLPRRSSKTAKMEGQSREGRHAA